MQSANIIAIDGPAGSGKSTVAPLVADALGFLYIDSGAVYRRVGLAALDLGVDVGDHVMIEAVAADLFSVSPTQEVLFEAVSPDAIRTPAVSEAASTIGTHQRLRALVTECVRRWANESDGAVLDGRDIGTVVFPDARLKIWLTADVGIRAERRAIDLGHNQQDVLADIERRDSNDANREMSPMVPSSESIRLDTTKMTAAQVVGAIVTLYQDGIGCGGR